MDIDSCDTMRLKFTLCRTVTDVTNVKQLLHTRDAVEHMWQWRYMNTYNPRTILSWWYEEHGNIGYNLAVASYGAHW